MPIDRHMNATAIARSAITFGMMSAVGVPAGPGMVATMAIGLLGARLLPSGIQNCLWAISDKYIYGNLFGRAVPLPDDDRLSTLMRDLVSTDQTPPSVYQVPDGGMIAAARNPETGQYVILVDKNVTNHIPDPEIKFILAHEYSHIRKNDPDVSMGKLSEWGVMLGGLTKAVIEGMTQHNPALIVGFAAGAWAMSRLFDVELRSKERRADLGAIEATGHPDAGMAALAKTAFVYTVVTGQLTDSTRKQFQMSDGIVDRLVNEPDLIGKNPDKIVDILEFNQGVLWRERPFRMAMQQINHLVSHSHPTELERIRLMRKWRQDRVTVPDIGCKKEP